MPAHQVKFGPTIFPVMGGPIRQDKPKGTIAIPMRLLDYLVMSIRDGRTVLAYLMSTPRLTLIEATKGRYSETPR